MSYDASLHTDPGYFSSTTRRIVATKAQTHHCWIFQFVLLLLQISYY